MTLRLRLTHKIMLLMFTVVVISIAGIAVISTMKVTDSLTGMARADLGHTVSLARDMCRMAAYQSRQQVSGDLELARLAFRDLSRSRVVDKDGLMILDPDGAGLVINEDSRFVDDITDKTGAFCSVYLVEDRRARQISAGKNTADGQSAVGIRLPDGAFNAVVGLGQTFIGRTATEGGDYLTACAPISNDNQDVVGILVVARPEQPPALRQALLARTVGEKGRLFCLDSRGIFRLHPDREGENISALSFTEELVTRAPQLAEDDIGWIEYQWDDNGKTTDKIAAYAYLGDWDWIIAAGSDLDDLTAPVTGLRRAILIPGIICLLISLAAGFFLSRAVTRPITALVDAAEAIAVGDVSREVTVVAGDEIGVLADSFRNMTAYLQATADAARRIAENDLTVRVETRSSDDVLGNAFQTMIANLTGMIYELKANTEDLVSAAAGIASSSEQMACGARSQTEQADQVASAVIQMSATITESSKNANEARENSSRASDISGGGRAVVADTIESLMRISKSTRQAGTIVNQLAGASNKIGEIVGVIDDIADQTNLLALNAAIEAARAGDQGRGFAVVADEVRQLAEKTAKATGQVTDMIKGIQSDSARAVSSMEEAGKLVEEGRTLADKAGLSLNEISAMAGRVSDMIIQIAAAADEQSAAAEEIARNIEHIGTVTRETAAGAEQSAASAEELNRQAESLKILVRQFKVVDIGD